VVVSEHDPDRRCTVRVARGIEIAASSHRMAP
jgi:hypothetical protein